MIWWIWWLAPCYKNSITLILIEMVTVIIRKFLLPLKKINVWSYRWYNYSWHMVMFCSVFRATKYKRSRALKIKKMFIAWQNKNRNLEDILKAIQFFVKQILIKIYFIYSELTLALTWTWHEFRNIKYKKSILKLIFE